MNHQCTPGIDSHVLLGISKEVWWDALFNKTEQRLKGEIKDPVAIVRNITDQIDSEFSDSLIREVAESRATRFRHALSNVLPHVIDTLVKLKGKYKLALLSNADLLERAGFEKTALAQTFDEIVFSCDVGFAKPEPGIYNYCLDKLKLAPSQAIFIGDGGSNELVGARDVGLDTVFTSEFIKDLLPGSLDQRSKTATHRIHSISELLNAEFLIN